MRRHKKDNPVELSNMDSSFQTDRASRFFRKGYNCAQSVFAAHAEKLGLDLDTALKISAPLGGGVGRMREICGAFSACAMLAGWAFFPPVVISTSANILFSLIPCAIQIVVAGVAYIMGGNKEKLRQFALEQREADVSKAKGEKKR